jgi:hypothetical protein
MHLRIHQLSMNVQSIETFLIIITNKTISMQNQKETISIRKIKQAKSLKLIKISSKDQIKIILDYFNRHTIKLTK